ncbi:MAG: DUF460 domain-containing protein [Thermoproteota archaeon]
MQPPKRLLKAIVGLDPGTTTGLAIMSLNGEILLLKSLRHWSRSDIIMEILNAGNPVLLATDKAEIPKAVRELSQVLKLMVFKVERESTLEDKKVIVKEFASRAGVEVKDEHQISALYAAIKAFNNFKNEFNNIELLVERRMSDFKNVLVDEVKGDLIKGIPPERSIRERLSQTLIQSVDKDLVEQLRKQLLEERRKVEVLTLKLEGLRGELRRMETKKPIERGDKTVITFTPAGNRITSLGEVLKEETGPGELVQVDVFAELTSKKAKSEVKSTVVAAKTLKGDLIKIFKALSSRDVKVLILDAETTDEEILSEALRQGLLLCDMKSLPLEKVDENLYIRRSDVRRILDKKRSLLTSALFERLKGL